MTNKDIKNAVEYWRKTAEHDYGTMQALYRGKQYSNSLFFGHIVLEKLLKGLVVKETGEQAPEQKFKFYKKSTQKYAKGNLDGIKNMYKNLCQKLK